MGGLTALGLGVCKRDIAKKKHGREGDQHRFQFELCKPDDLERHLEVCKIFRIVQLLAHGRGNAVLEVVVRRLGQESIVGWEKKQTNKRLEFQNGSASSTERAPFSSAVDPRRSW